MTARTTAPAIKTLQHLLDVCTDGVEGYRRAASKISDPELHDVLEKNAEERDEMARALERALVELGQAAPRRTTLEGALHRGWLTTLGTVHAEDALIKECIRGERTTIDAFQDALATDLPLDVRTRLEPLRDRVATALASIEATKTSPRRSVPPERGEIAAEGAGAVAGALTGALVGAIGGPVGSVAGGVLGALAGGAAGKTLAEVDIAAGAKDRELDRVIGVTEGNLGAASPKQPPARIGAPSTASSGAGGAARQPAEGVIADIDE